MDFVKDEPTSDVSRGFDDSEEPVEELEVQKAMLHAHFKLNHGEGKTSTPAKLGSHPSSSRSRVPEDRSQHFEMVKRQLRAEEEEAARFRADEAMDDDSESRDSASSEFDVPAGASGASGSDEGDDEDDDDDLALQARIDPFRPLFKGVRTTTTGSRLWCQGSSILYHQLLRHLFHFASRALKMRKTLKPASDATGQQPTDGTRDGPADTDTAQGPAKEASENVPREVVVSPREDSPRGDETSPAVASALPAPSRPTSPLPSPSRPSSLGDVGYRIVDDGTWNANELAGTNVARIVDGDELCERDESHTPSADERSNDADRVEAIPVIAGGATCVDCNDEKEQRMLVTSSPQALPVDEHADGVEDCALVNLNNPTSLPAALEGSEENLGGEWCERSEESTDGLTPFDWRSLHNPRESSSRFPAIDDLFERQWNRVVQTLQFWGAEISSASSSSSSDDDDDDGDDKCGRAAKEQWLMERQHELFRCLELLWKTVTAEVHTVADASRKMFRTLDSFGFPDMAPSTVWHDTAVMRASEMQCYSYHPRLFPTMTTLNANFHVQGLTTVLNLESTDRRLGRPSMVPVPHPHPDVNTRVIVVEPKKKKSMIDDFRTLPLPRKAGTHGAEDFLVEEELEFRHAVQLMNYLNRTGTLRGLPSHLYPVVYELLDYDVEEFAKLQSAKRTFLSSVPAPLMRRITDALRRKVSQLEATRAAARRAVGKIGFYCQGVYWRDQIVNCLETSTSRFGQQYASMQEMTSLLLVPNPCGASATAAFLTEALPLFLDDTFDDALRRTLLGWLLPMLQGSWEAATAKLHGKGRWEPAWGPESSDGARSYMVTCAVVLTIQALLHVSDTLLVAQLNTTKWSALEFLTKFRAVWSSDTGAAAFLLAAERTTNLATARLVGLRCAVEQLKMKLIQLSEERGEEMAMDLMTAAKSSDDRDSATRYFVATHSQHDLHAVLFRLMVSDAPVAFGMAPTLAILEVPRTPPASEVTEYFRACEGGTSSSGSDGEEG